MLKSIPKLLVGSVFVPHKNTAFWYNLQIQYLKKTIGKFKHVVCVNGDIDHSLFNYSQVITASDHHCCDAADGIFQSNNHYQGLSALISYFRKNQSEDYLILDSDCFPIMNNWHECLKSKMQNFKFAAPYRFENLDFFPHPCAFFIRGSHICDLNLNFIPTKTTSLIGNKIKDVGCGISKENCYPLIRSNFTNLHPIFSAIYNHMFYHHGCGSRSLMTRSINSGYFNHYLNNEFHLCKMNSLIDELKNNPDKFINLLMEN